MAVVGQSQQKDSSKSKTLLVISDEAGNLIAKIVPEIHGRHGGPTGVKFIATEKLSR